MKKAARRDHQLRNVGRSKYYLYEKLPDSFRPYPRMESWRDKLLGTLVWPGGAIGLYLLVGMASRPALPGGPRNMLAYLLFFALITAPLLVAIRLARRIGPAPLP